MNPSEEWHLETRQIGRRVRVYKRMESTNTQAALLADDPSNHGLVIMAEEQTSGRGQQGRSWQAPAGKAVLMSVVVFPPPPLRRPALLTAWAAVSVCESIRQATGFQAKIKWPNDVLIRGRKVCGILIESKVQASRSGRKTRTGDNRGNREEKLNSGFLVLCCLLLDFFAIHDLTAAAPTWVAGCWRVEPSCIGRIACCAIAFGPGAACHLRDRHRRRR